MSIISVVVGVSLTSLKSSILGCLNSTFILSVISTTLSTFICSGIFMSFMLISTFTYVFISSGHITFNFKTSPTLLPRIFKNKYSKSDSDSLDGFTSLKVHAVRTSFVALTMSDCLPVSLATSNIFSSFTRKGLYFTVFPEGNFNSYFDEFTIGNAIIFHSLLT